MSIDVTVVIPVYNEEEILEEALVELLENLRQHQNHFEVIVSANRTYCARTRNLGTPGRLLRTRFGQLITLLPSLRY